MSKELPEGAFHEFVHQAEIDSRWHEWSGVRVGVEVASIAFAMLRELITEVSGVRTTLEEIHQTLKKSK